MKSKQVKVFAPATIANVGPGFDVLGIALSAPGDTVIAKRKAELGLSFTLDAEHHAQLSPADSNNVAAYVATMMLTEFNPPFGIDLILQKNMPIGSGLGSSGASAAAAVLAVNQLLPKKLTKKDLIPFAVAGEKFVCGTGHADNVAPALLGGICLIRSYAPLDVIQLPYQNKLTFVVAHPNLFIATRMAREKIPTEIALTTAIAQIGNLGALITGFSLGDPTIIAHALKDHIAEPVRASLIPGYEKIKQAAMIAGAIGFSISGSGPSVFAITTSLASAQHIATNLKQAFIDYAATTAETYISMINPEGATIIEESV